MSGVKFTTALALLFVTTLAVCSHAQVTFSQQGASLLGGANFNSRSASVADIDDDGDLDLLFQGATGAQQLYRNNAIGTGTGFSNISSQLPSGLGPSWSAAWGDYDGDGLVDVFVGQSNIGGTGDVLKNNGLPGFSNESTATGLNDPGFHQNVAWNDIDNDRDLDLIIAMEGPERHEIYLQDSSGQFSAFGALAGIQNSPGVKAYGMAIGDTDGDGDMDLYISTCNQNNFIRNHFYENQLAQTGTLSFVDIADTNGTQFLTNSYGAEFHDFDDDGRLDLFMVGADGQPSKMWRNDGNNMFTDVDTMTGHSLLSDVSGDLNGGKAVDYDNDGDLDLFFHDHKPNGTANQARKLYRNDGNWEFTDVTNAAGIAASNEGAYDSVWADIDLDGDQDLIAPTDSGSAERIFVSNAHINGNHWLYVDLSGPSDNTTGIAATLYATIDQGLPTERTLRREANTNAGTFNQSDLPVHFGLGSATQIDELRIEWPDGTIQYLHSVSVNQRLSVATSAFCDFDANGVCDLADINAMLAQGPLSAGVAVTNGSNDQFDLNGDGVIDNDDVDQWLADAAASRGLGSPFIRGDANLDGQVDVSDFNLWNSNKFSTNLAWDAGNFNADGVVDISDFNVWNQNKFASSDAVASVPEPDVAVWMLIVATALFRREPQSGRIALRTSSLSK